MKIKEFNSAVEEWRHYVERMNHFFEANDIDDRDKKRSIFLVSVGAKTYKLLRSLVAPEDPKTKTYDELTKIVQDHYQPKPSVIVERFKFNTRCQQQGETIPMILAKLRRLSENCEFGSTLEEMLRDRLVCGTSDNRIQRRLLAEPKLSLKRALDLAIAIETSEKDALKLQKSLPRKETDLNKLDGKGTKYPKSRNSVKCSRCDGKHSPAECRFKDAKCHPCGKSGHLSRACRSKNKAKKPERRETAHHLAGTGQEETVSDNSSEDEGPPSPYGLYTFHSNNTPYKVNMSINGIPMDMEIDTGASLSVMSEEKFTELRKGQPTLVPTEVVLHTYTGEEIKPLGSLDVKVCYEGKEFQLPLLVVQPWEGSSPVREKLADRNMPELATTEAAYTNSSAVREHYSELCPLICRWSWYPQRSHS